MRILKAYFLKIFAFFLKKTNCRILKAHYPNRIGHLALDIDCYLKEQILLAKNVHPILILNDEIVANQTLLQYWRRYVTVIRSRYLSKIANQLFLLYPELFDDLVKYSNVTDRSAKAYDIQGRWGSRPPLLQLSAAHQEQGRKILRELGIPEGAWFVCIHAREAGYSPSDEHVHSHRNVKIESMIPAMKDIIARGGWCIRMGESSVAPLPPLEGVVDYARSPFKSDWMDVYLCASCRFFLGNTSGLYVVSAIFGKPSALTNMVPLDCVYSPFPFDVSIPRTMTIGDESLPLAKTFASELARFRLTQQFVEAGVQQKENSAEEIRGLAREVLDRMAGPISDSKEDLELQLRFKSLLREGHYSWPPHSRIGREFLRNHAEELESL